MILLPSTTASYFSDSIGSRGPIDPIHQFIAAIRYNNPAAYKKFGFTNSLPSVNFNDKLKVTSKNKSCIVQVKDWGPNTNLPNRGIDLSEACFKYLAGDLNIGLINNVQVELVPQSVPIGPINSILFTEYLNDFTYIYPPIEL